MMQWDDLKYFLALARRKTLVESAQTLKVTRATISRRVESLEELLGAPLFDRRPDGYFLNRAGKKLFEEAKMMESAAADFEGEFRSDAPSRDYVLTIATPASLADGFLIEALRSIAASHTATIEVVTRMHLEDLLRGDADVAIVFGEYEEADVVAELLARVEFRFYCTQAYKERIGEGGSYRFITFTSASSTQEARWLREHFPQHDAVLSADSVFSQAIAASTGLGVVLLPRYLSGRFPTLQEVDLGLHPPDGSISMLTRVDSGSKPGVPALKGLIVRAFNLSTHLFKLSTSSSLSFTCVFGSGIILAFSFAVENIC